MFNHKKHILAALVMCMIIAFASSPVFAVNSDGTGPGDGSGTGENRDIPLTLESSSVSDGALDVPLNETIQLDFNKNICSVTVLANNKLCFHLTDAEGTPAAIRLIFPDNQVQTEYKRQVFIQPVEYLKPETEYRIAVDNTLMAKNGTTIDDAHTLSFTTGTSRTDEENSILRELDDYIVTYETESGENANSVPLNKSDLDEVGAKSGPDTAFMARIAAAGLILIVLVFTTVFVVIRLRRRRG
ncbi:MAG: Ig-like domain-containing protein [Firmicutes bacterium]|nr:Ig-like domain-containing protein [Bacillota bacterium]